jgi:hypothetical protein
VIPIGAHALVLAIVCVFQMTTRQTPTVTLSLATVAPKI